MNKEQNFISAVVGLDGDSAQDLQFFKVLFDCLDKHFIQFEIIAVNKNGARYSAKELRDWAKNLSKPLTIINMSQHQPHEQCMNAGLDCAIGDYIYEIDSTQLPYSPELFWQAYELAQQGNDIVTVCPTRERWTSRMFYGLFNAYSPAAYQLRTDAFRLVSRRALNRTHAINENLPYRKAAYAACGLKMAELEFDGAVCNNRPGKFKLATDSLVLYTDFGYKFSVGFTVLMMLATLAELIYTLVVWLTGNPIAGWTTTMFVLTFSLTGLFSILAILLKYITLLLKLFFNKQSYLVESIEKL